MNRPAVFAATAIALVLMTNLAMAAPIARPDNPNSGGGLPGCGPSGGRPSKCSSVPEIDLASGAASLAALLAGLALAMERRRKT